MSFVAKDKNSRKDKLEASSSGEGPEVRSVARAVIHKTPGGSHLHLALPESAFNKESHLDELLSRLEARENEESAAS